ncbi:MAG TPA: hypothetical protein VLA52_02065 [Thermohalobaculum sp.]|nr:hypothetical protein [Thermohalobaculum sp.]
MTPLAHAIATELTLPRARRTFDDQANVLSHITEAVCFEVTEVVQIANALVAEFIADAAPACAFRGLAFLPAPKTWIEFRDQNVRHGLLLTQSDRHNVMARIDAASTDGFGSYTIGDLPLDGNDDLGLSLDADMSIYKRHPYASDFVDAALFTYALLSLINSPRRINQRVVQPHAGLQRKLARTFGGVGKYPLHAYRELTLKCGPPVDARDEPAWIDYLNNRMPLHFVRAHRRRNAGVDDPRYDPHDYATWDLIKATWRGDSALGIKLTRYKLAA